MDDVEAAAAPPTLETPRCALRLPAASEARAMVDYFVRNREHLAPFEPPRPAVFYTAPWWEDRLRRDLEDWQADRSLRLALVLREDPARVVGTVGLSNFVRGAFQACHLGFGLDGDLQGRGLMREALEAVLALAFGPLRFHRAMANHLPENRRSEALLVRLGFECEGYARDYLRIGGRWRDHVLRSRINRDWRPEG